MVGLARLDLVRSAAVEAFWLAAHLAAYPAGALGDAVLRNDLAGHRPHRLDDLPLRERGYVATAVAATGRPVVLVHGLIDNRSAFPVLGRGLRRRGFDRVVAYDYSPRTSDLRVAAAGLGTWVDELLRSTGEPQVHLVGHSLGGLVGRYYVQCLGGSERVDTLVTLGTPHAGTRTAALLPSSLGRQLRPGSSLLAELEAPVDRCPTRMVAIWSDVDQVVRPVRSATITHPGLVAHNVRVGSVGHWSLPMDRRVVGLVAAGLVGVPRPTKLSLS